MVNPSSGQVLIETTAGNSTSLLMYTYGSSIFQIQSDGVEGLIGWGSSQEREVNFVNTGAGDIKVGIGTDSPDAKLHVYNGDSGATTVGSASNEFILENDTDCGLTIRSGTSAIVTGKHAT